MIGLAAAIVRSLHRIWKAEDISKSTEVLLYKTLVQSVVLYIIIIIIIHEFQSDASPEELQGRWDVDFKGRSQKEVKSVWNVSITDDLQNNKDR